jgi:hypothetical protein
MCVERSMFIEDTPWLANWCAYVRRHALLTHVDESGT